ncbi:MAG TPA: flagellar basal body rod C-terminal domain-containing protein [Alphaproteobacteria bacterium]|nr:flagellar basal body rod C-terminal domain-containing protein [Alphaproteobacteria bacterium]
MTDVFSIALSGLGAQQKRLASTASNIANASTAGTVPGTVTSAPASTAGGSTVYKPLNVNLTSLASGGVRADVTADANGYSLAYDPSSPYANSEGMIAVPNVDLTTEMVNLLEIKTSYKANLAVLKTQDEMLGALLDTST